MVILWIKEFPGSVQVLNNPDLYIIEDLVIDISN